MAEVLVIGIGRTDLSRVIILLLMAFVCAVAQAGDPVGYSTPPSNFLAPVQTSRQVYAVKRTPNGHAVSIRFVYTNTTRDKVYLPTCNGVHPPVLEKWVQGAWITAYAAVVQMCLGPPEIVGAQEKYRYIFKILAAPRGSNTYPQFEVPDILGRYRLVWEIYETWMPNDTEPGLGPPAPAQGARIEHIQTDRMNNLGNPRAGTHGAPAVAAVSGPCRLIVTAPRASG